MSCQCCCVTPQPACCPTCIPRSGLFVTFQNVTTCPALANVTVPIKWDPVNSWWFGTGTAVGGATLSVWLVCLPGVNPESSCYNQTSWQLSFSCRGVMTDTQTDNPPSLCACDGTPFGSPGLLLNWPSIAEGVGDTCGCGICSATVAE